MGSNDIKSKLYMFMFCLKNLARKGLIKKDRALPMLKGVELKILKTGLEHVWGMMLPI